MKPYLVATVRPIGYRHMFTLRSWIWYVGGQKEYVEHAAYDYFWMLR